MRAWSLVLLLLFGCCEPPPAIPAAPTEPPQVESSSLGPASPAPITSAESSMSSIAFIGGATGNAAIALGWRAKIDTWRGPMLSGHDPDCRAKKRFPGTSGRTLMAPETFVDRDGHWHHHDPNATTTFWTCSEGHKWAEVTDPPKCAWCTPIEDPCQFCGSGEYPGGLAVGSGCKHCESK